MVTSNLQELIWICCLRHAGADSLAIKVPINGTLKMGKKDIRHNVMCEMAIVEMAQS